ncbi:hypothetical protein AAG906_004338 [Vitis piasezkii]
MEDWLEVGRAIASILDMNGMVSITPFSIFKELFFMDSIEKACWLQELGRVSVKRGLAITLRRLSLRANTKELSLGCLLEGVEASFETKSCESGANDGRREVGSSSWRVNQMGARRFIFCFVIMANAKWFALIFLEGRGLHGGWSILTKKLRSLGVVLATKARIWAWWEMRSSSNLGRVRSKVGKRSSSLSGWEREHTTKEYQFWKTEITTSSLQTLDSHIPQSHIPRSQSPPMIESLDTMVEPPRTRPHSIHSQPANNNDFIVYYRKKTQKETEQRTYPEQVHEAEPNSNHSEISPSNTNSDPVTNELQNDSLNLPIAKRKGKAVVGEEIRALEKNGTWEIMELPKGKNPVGCKWIFTIKYKANASVDRFNAHLVGKGFTQTYGIDYQETFAPIAKLNTIWVLLSWSLHQLGVQNAFLNGYLEEEMYMEIPSSIETRSNINKVYRLKKSLYVSKSLRPLDLTDLQKL